MYVKASQLLERRDQSNWRIQKGQKWDGPFTITGVLGPSHQSLVAGEMPVNLVLDFESAGYKNKPTVVNVVDCKPCVQSDLRLVRFEWTERARERRQVHDLLEPIRQAEPQW